MKIKDGFVLREVAGSYMVIATGEASKEFHGMIRLNQTGADIWQGVADGLTQEEIAQRLLEKYDGVTLEKAMTDVASISSRMKEAGFLTD